MHGRWRRRGVRLGLGGVALAGVALGVGWAAGERLVARPGPPVAEALPVSPGLGLEELHLWTSDGLELGAWFSAGKPGRPVVVLLHGRGGRRSEMLEEAGWLDGLGVGVLMLSLRGHGDSGGERVDGGVGASLDVVAAVDLLGARAAGRPIGVWGRSFGAAAALAAAEPLGDRVAGYALLAPYLDLESSVLARTRERLGRPLGGLAGALLIAAAPLVGVDRAAHDGRSAARRLPGGRAVLVLAGESDRLAPPGEARLLAEALGEDVRFAVVPGAGHTHPLHSDPLARAELERWLAALDPGAPE